MSIVEYEHIFLTFMKCLYEKINININYINTPLFFIVLPK